MKTPLVLIADLLYLCLLCCASLFVPAPQRAEWFKEWRSELWHVRRGRMTAGFSLDAEREIAAFCLGAFQDAFCIRQQLGHGARWLALSKGSAARCLLFLGAVLAAGYGISLLSPGVRNERQKELNPLRSELVLVRSALSNDDTKPTIGAGQFLLWKSRGRQLFDGLAFYQVMQQPISQASEPALSIAYASPNLFKLLGVTLRFAQPPGERQVAGASVVLSDELWRRDFGSSSDIVGRTIRVGEQEVRVGGVTPAGFDGLPGKVDAWLLEPTDYLFSDLPGFVVAHVDPYERRELWSVNGRVTSPRPGLTPGEFVCTSLDDRTPGGWRVFAFAIFVAFLALPATTSLPLGEYRVSTQRRSWSIRLRRWSFLAAKTGMLLPIAFYVPLDLAYSNTTLQTSSAVYVQLIASFSICLFGLRWMLRDQRQRCPVCLNLLEHPAKVGQASHSFLAWNGIELICTGGHGLLHVPEMPTSWFSTQRWIYLDASWNVLFSEPHVLTSGYF
jgi:hypothetical protein